MLKSMQAEGKGFNPFNLSLRLIRPLAELLTAQFKLRSVQTV